MRRIAFSLAAAAAAATALAAPAAAQPPQPPPGCSVTSSVAYSAAVAAVMAAPRSCAARARVGPSAFVACRKGSRRDSTVAAGSPVCIRAARSTASEAALKSSAVACPSAN